LAKQTVGGKPQNMTRWAGALFRTDVPTSLASVGYKCVALRQEEGALGVDVGKDQIDVRTTKTENFLRESSSNITPAQ